MLMVFARRSLERRFCYPRRDSIVVGSHELKFDSCGGTYGRRATCFRLSVEPIPPAGNERITQNTIYRNGSRTVAVALSIVVVGKGSERPPCSKMAIKSSAWLKILLLLLSAAALLLRTPLALQQLQLQTTATAASGLGGTTTARAAGKKGSGPDLHPENLQEKCVAVRFRGSSTTWSVDEAIEYWRTTGSSGSRHQQPLSVGLVFLDRQGGFLSIGKPGVFHLYHFLEFLVVSYNEMHRLAAPPATGGGLSSAMNPTSLSQGSPSIHISWIYTPMFYRSEMCGVAGGINCLIADLVLQATSSSSTINDDWKTKFYGLESNDKYTRQIHPVFTGEHSRRKNWSPANRTDPQSNNGLLDYQSMQDDADAVFIVSRSECNRGGVNKMWFDFIDGFPADAWHTDVVAGLGGATSSSPSSSTARNQKDKIVVGYVDRQNTNRIMPEREHEWLIGYLTDHPMIDFMHLHMEDYTPLEQIRIASQCDVLIGVHGNGLSHALWMPPERYVIEIFWQFRYQFDYMTAAQLMRHEYLGLFNGSPIDSELVRTRDKSLRAMPKKVVVNEQNFTAFLDDIEEGRQAVMNFLQNAMVELQVR